METHDLKYDINFCTLLIPNATLLSTDGIDMSGHILLISSASPFALGSKNKTSNFRF